MSSSVRTLISITALACSLTGLVAGNALAGDVSLAPKQTQAPAPESDWQFNLALPSWFISTAGKIGLNGYSTQMYLGVDTVLKDLDFIATFQAEVRKGKFGIYSDFLYVSASDGMDPGGLLQKVDVRLDEYLVNLDVNYRLIEGPRGYLDVRAGVRYTNIYNKVSTQPDDAEIDAAAARLVEDATMTLNKFLAYKRSGLDIAGLVDAAIKAKISDRLSKLPEIPVSPARRPGQPVEALAAASVRLIENLPALRSLLQESRLADAEILRLSAPEFGNALIDLPAIQRAMAVKGKLKKKIEDLKQEIQRQIAAQVKKDLKTNASLTEYWFDPYIGLRGRYNFNRAVYFTASADVGGFGISSDITAQGYGALGFQLTRNMYAEFGYRYLYTDYNQDGFLYRVDQQGVQITAGISF